MTFDEYNEVTLSEETCIAIADRLNEGKAVMIGWTDEESSHFDILFTFTADKYGPVQGGISPYSDLFVSIMRKGAFAFAVGKESDSSPAYYAEKLFFNEAGSTVQKLAQLINGVRQKL